jgi:pimeloyl-ACP methyl ester carboxylesterase
MRRYLAICRLLRAVVFAATALSLGVPACIPAGSERGGTARASANSSPRPPVVLAVLEHFQGTIDYNDDHVGFAVGIERAGDKVSGSIRAPNWGPNEWPLRDVFRTETRIAFAVGPATAPNGSFELARVTGGFVGTYTWEGAKYPARMGLDAVPEASRPAVEGFPVPPFPYVTTAVRFAGGSGQAITGTLTVPDHGAKHPGIVIIRGSGLGIPIPVIPGDPEPACALWAWADRISRADFVTLSMNPRGAGGSEGNKDDASIGELGDDALAAVAYLRARPDIGSGAVVGIIGFSEGASVATLAAATNPSTGFLVRVSGSAVPWTELGPDQTRTLLMWATRGHTDLQPQIEFTVARKKLIYELAAQGLSELEVQRKLAAWQEEQRARGGRSFPKSDVSALIHYATGRLVRSELAYDPAVDLRRLQCPLLDVRGDADPLVSAEQSLPPLRKALMKSGNADATVKVFHALNHPLCHSHLPGFDNDRNELFAEDAANYVLAWLHAHSERRKTAANGPGFRRN